MTDKPTTNPCTRNEDCEFDASHWPHTPCGQIPVHCPNCGFPLPRETDLDFKESQACPHGWRTATVADIKQLAAEEGWDTDVEIDDGTVKATIIPPHKAEASTGEPEELG